MAVALAVTTLLMCGLAELRVRALLSGARVNPAGIGLTLGVALSRSVSFTVALAVVVTLAWSRSDSSWPCHSGGGASTPPGHGLPQHRLRARARLLRRPRAAGDLRGVCDLAGGGLHGQGGERSEVRQRSAPAAALRVALLAIQADRARVQPTSKAPTLPGNWDLNDRSVLYLGQSGGVGVLYDADRGEWSTPMVLVVLHVSNCTGPAPHPRGGPASADELRTDGRDGSPAVRAAAHGDATGWSAPAGVG
jgi:hypothetical protein